MPTYQVYYARRLTFHAGGELGTPLLTVSRLQTSHVHLCGIEASCIDAAFQQMQGENWSPKGEAWPVLKRLGLSHTSMSVGDAIRDEEGSYWECVEWGWRRIEDDTGEGSCVLHDEPPEEPNP